MILGEAGIYLVYMQEYMWNPGATQRHREMNVEK